MNASRAHARVQLELLAEGGRAGPVRSGYTPACEVVAGYLTSTRLEFGADDAEPAWLAPGATCEAWATFLTPEAYPRSLAAGQRLRLSEGAKTIGSITIVEVLEPLLRRHE